MSARYLVLLGALVLAAWGFRRWRQATLVAMLLVVAEGALRKWVFPGAQDLVYFTKDALLLGVYAGFLTSHTRSGQSVQVPAGLTALLASGAVLGLAQVFNPDLPNLLVGLLGFKAYFLYVPLLWVVPAAFADDRHLARFLHRYVVVAIPVGVLAAAQFVSPPTSALNSYARPEVMSGYVTTFGSSPQVRVTGTFSYITGYSSYVFTITVLLLAILAATSWRYRGNLLHYLALGVTLLGMLMTGSRGPVLMLVLLLPLYWWLGVAREWGAATTAGRILLGGAVIATLINYVGSDAVEAFYGRASSGTDVVSRVWSPLVQPLRTLPESGLLGFGIGATHQTAAAVTPNLVPYSWMRGLLVEDEPGRIMLELGALGFFLVYSARIYLIFLALQRVFVLRTAFHRAIATSCVLFFLAHLLGGVVFNVTAGVYYWFFAGLLLLVTRLDQEAVAAATAGQRVPRLLAHRPPPATLRPSPSFPRQEQWPLPPA